MDEPLPSEPLFAEGFVGGAAESPAPRIMGFEIVSRIGTGAMAEVWLARQLGRLERRVAVKVVRRDRLDAERLARFQTEARALAASSDPRIVRPFEAGLSDDGRPYLAMEWFDGDPLESRGAACDLSLDDRIRLMLEVAGAVASLHASGIIHRDLKPGNVLVARRSASGSAADRACSIRVIDLGLAKFIGVGLDGSTVDGTLVGTPEFMSPEQAGTIDAMVSPASDVFSLGVMLYELIEERLPWSRHDRGRGSTDAAGFQRLLERMRDQRPDLPTRCDSHLASIAMRAVESDPRRRYRSAGELKQALESWIQSGGRRERFKSWVALRVGRMLSLNSLQIAAALGVCMASLAGWFALRGAGVPHAGHLALAWSEQSGRICRAELDGSGIHLIAKGWQSPRGIAFDTRERFLYWADFGGRLERSRIDGTERSVLAGYPNIVNVALFADQLLWCHYGDEPRIWIARNDGVGPKWLTKAVKSPTGVRAIGDGRFVFSDWELNGIFVVRRGEMPERIALVDGAYGIDYRDGWVFFGDRTSERIMSVHVDSKRVRVLAEGELVKGVWQVAVHPDGSAVYWTQQSPANAIRRVAIRAEDPPVAPRGETVLRLDANPWGLAIIPVESDQPSPLGP
jgi:tRNA A-37 threonylcarbamoyl transferase component Bud32